MATLPRFLDSGDVILTAVQNIAQTLGSPGSVLVLKLVNNPASAAPGVDPLDNGRIVAMFRNAGETVWKTAGTEWADRGYLEVRITGPFKLTTGVGTTGFQPIGANAELQIPVSLGDDEGIEMEFRVNAPGDALDDAEEVALRVESRSAEPAIPGVSTSVGDGLVLPVRDAGESLLVHSVGPTVENPGGADDQVEVQDSIWIGSGSLFSAYQSLEVIDAATAGNEKVVLIVLRDDDTITILEGPDETPPATTLPAFLASDVVITQVQRDDTATIVNADLTDKRFEAFGLYAFRSSGLTGFIARGPRALVDGSALTNQIEQPVTLTASDSNFIWLLRDGSLAVTLTLDPPSDRALLIHEADTNATVVTAHRDRRELVGIHRSVLTFSWPGPLVVGAERTLFLPSFRDASILPFLSIVATIGLQAVTPASGETRFDLEYKEPGSGFTNLFFDTFHRPRIAFDAAELSDVKAIPQLMKVGGSAIIRATVDAIPAGAASPPEDGALTLSLAL